MKKSTQLRQLIATGKTYFIPGAYDGLSARLIQTAGAEMVYATGGGIARSTGVPDMGLLTAKEVADRLEQIVDAVDLPVIADMDTGYGNALNARRAAKAFQRVGVAGFHLEDQLFPKRCGHLEGKTLIPAEEHCAKIRAVKDVIENDTVLIARTDAIAVEGIDQAMQRMHSYIEAGADVAFVEAPQTMEHLTRIANEFTCPKLLNMFWGGKTPVISRQQLEKLGFNLVIVPGDLQRAAITAMQHAAKAILEDGHTESMADRMASFEDRESAVNTAHYMKLNQKFSS